MYRQFEYSFHCLEPNRDRTRSINISELNPQHFREPVIPTLSTSTSTRGSMTNGEFTLQRRACHLVSPLVASRFSVHLWTSRRGNTVDTEHRWISRVEKSIRETRRAGNSFYQAILACTDARTRKSSIAIWNGDLCTPNRRILVYAPWVNLIGNFSYCRRAVRIASTQRERTK